MFLTQPVYVYPSSRSISLTMNTTGSNLHPISRPSPASSRFPGELPLSKAFWLQLCMHVLHELYQEYSPGIAAVCSSIRSEFHLKRGLKLLGEFCPFKSKFFHISTLTSSEVGFRSELQRCLRMSQYWAIPAFMHRNRRKKGEKREESR